MVKYVVGFLFDGNGKVCLIHKNRPDWQKGRLNGVGGHIENSETPRQAMRREFQEEAGFDTNSWREFCLVRGAEYELHCLSYVCHEAHVKSMTDEKVGWYNIRNLPSNIIPNLTWLIPMANYKLDIKAVVYHSSPEC